MRHSIFYLGRLTAEKNLFIQKFIHDIRVIQCFTITIFIEIRLAKKEFLFKRFLDLHYKEIQVLILMNENNS